MQEQHVSRAIGVAKIFRNAPFEIWMVDADALHVALEKPLARIFREAPRSEESVAAPRPRPQADQHDVVLSDLHLLLLRRRLENRGGDRLRPGLRADIDADRIAVELLKRH